MKIDFLPYFCKIKGENNARITTQMSMAMREFEIIFLMSYQDKVRIESQGSAH